MRFLKVISIVSCFLFIFSVNNVFAKANVIDLYTNAVMTADIPALEKLLAPNFWNIAPNGHIRDKEHFISELKNKERVINRLSLKNIRETTIGDTYLYTANGELFGKFTGPAPEGLMRFTIVVAKNKGEEQVVLFQATPVISTSECKDGNCKIK